MVDTTWFFAPEEAFTGDRVRLPSDETHHLTSVLRGAEGEMIVVVDGKGGWHLVRVENVHGDHVEGRVVDRQYNVGEPSYELTIGIGVIKRRSRFETFLEKAVELGACRIVPLLADHGEKSTIRADRSRRVLQAAMKQTRRSRLPVLEEPTDVPSFTGRIDGDHRYLCHGGASTARSLGDYLRGDEAGPMEEIAVAVGPEGGFSEREVERARRDGWRTVHLGNRRLRTETAGIVAAAVVQALADTVPRG